MKKLTKTEMFMKACVGLEVIAAVHGLIHFLNMDMYILSRIIGIAAAVDIIISSFHVFYRPKSEELSEYRKSRIRFTTCLILIFASLLLAFFGIVLPLNVAIAIVVNVFLIILVFNVFKNLKRMF